MIFILSVIVETKQKTKKLYIKNKNKNKIKIKYPPTTRVPNQGKQRWKKNPREQRYPSPVTTLDEPL
jgi:hypothetical protein